MTLGNIKEIKAHIKKMKPEKRALLEDLATTEDMTLVEYLADLYMARKEPGGSVIIINNSVTGDIEQNG